MPEGPYPSCSAAWHARQRDLCRDDLPIGSLLDRRTAGGGFRLGVPAAGGGAGASSAGGFVASSARRIVPGVGGRLAQRVAMPQAVPTAPGCVARCRGGSRRLLLILGARHNKAHGEKYRQQQYQNEKSADDLAVADHQLKFAGFLVLHFSVRSRARSQTSNYIDRQREHDDRVVLGRADIHRASAGTATESRPAASGSPRPPWPASRPPYTRPRRG